MASVTPVNELFDKLDCQYRIRRNHRAKRLSLSVDTYGAVDLTIPRHNSHMDAFVFVHEHLSWLLDQLHKQKLHRQTHGLLYELSPTQIILPSLQQQWRVIYHNRGEVTRLQEADYTLSIKGPKATEPAPVLQRWLRQKAKRYCRWLLDKLCLEHGLQYNVLSIRRQRTRWGSCSSRKNISLNQNIMFMHSGCVRYLCVHELCHTVHLNHSKQYWQLVKTIEPDYRRFENMLNQAADTIPAWAMFR